MGSQPDHRGLEHAVDTYTDWACTMIVEKRARHLSKCYKRKLRHVCNKLLQSTDKQKYHDKNQIYKTACATPLRLLFIIT